MSGMEQKLSEQEKAELDRRHRTERDGRVRDRIKAVLLNAEGWSNQQIAQALRINPVTVAQHLEDWFGEKKLKPENGGSQSHLIKKQEAQLDAYLQNNVQSSVQDICTWVEREFGVKYSVAGMTNWLHRNGFSYKKPKGVPAKADAQKQEDFVEDYFKLLEQVSEQDPVVFLDSVHPTMATKITHGWIKKGEDKAIATVASRTRVNTIGAIDLKTMEVLSSMVDTVNSETLTAFLSKLRQHFAQAKTIHLFLDQAPYNRSALVQVAAKLLDIELHYLPPYSPNLNPIERLWKIMNEHVRNNVVFENAKTFRQAISDFFEKTIPKITHILRSRINDNFQTLQFNSSS
jgi:transposase